MAGTNTFNFTLGGMAYGNPVLTPAAFNVTHGTPATVSFTATVSDVDGNVIPHLDSPLAISQTDASGAYVLSATSLPDGSGAQAVTITYNGANVPTTITVATTSADSALYNNGKPFTSSITITPK